MMQPFDLEPNQFSFDNIHRPVLKVLGLGGGGCNAIQRMMELGISGVEFIAANTDQQALAVNSAPTKIHLGPVVTRGLGAGGNPRIGQAAAEESSREIAEALTGADMVFLTAGMGGGTGTGSIPVAARIARSLGAVTIAIVTTPFSFEMGKRSKNAIEGLNLLRQQTNTLISIPNDRLLYIAPRKLQIEIAFRLADDVLRQAVQGITELITEPGLINVDFAHIRRLVQLGGGALMAIGQGRGEDKARVAVEQALHHPLLESVSIENAAGVIVNFTCGDALSLNEINSGITYLQSQTGPQTETVFGVIQDDRLEDRVQVILVITGLGAPTLEEAMASVMQPVKAAPQPEPTPPVFIPEPIPVTKPVEKVFQTSEPPEPYRQKSEYPLNPHDLDIPAFLRRRARMSGQFQVSGS